MTKKIDQTGIYASATNGQLYIGSTGAVPVLATITAGTNVTVTNGAGSISIAASGGGTGTGATTLLNYNAPGPSIRASTNVSSVTYSAVGKYIINYTSSYADANYYVEITTSDSPTGNNPNPIIGTAGNTTPPTTSAVAVLNEQSVGFEDSYYYMVTIYPG